MPSVVIVVVSPGTSAIGPDAAVGGLHLRIGLDQLAGLGQRQRAGAGGHAGRQPDVGRVALDIVEGRPEAEADGDHEHRNGQAADGQRRGQLAARMRPARRAPWPAASAAAIAMPASRDR